MGDVEVICKLLLNRLLYSFKVRPISPDQCNMTIKCHFMFLHLPELNMMHILDTLDIGDRLNHSVYIHVRRAAQHQHTNWVPNFIKCRVKNVNRDTYGNHGINPTKIAKDDERAVDNHRDRS